MNSLQMIVHYWMKSKRNFWVSLIFQLLSTLFALLTPIFIGRLVSSIDPNTPALATAKNLWLNFILVIIFGFFAFLTGRTGRVLGAEVSSSALYYLRADLNNTISNQSFSYFDKNETGQLVARATSDIDQTEMIFGFGLAVGVQSFIQIIGVLISAFAVQPILALILLSIIPISIIVSVIIARKLKPVYMVTRQAFGELTNTIRENIVGAQCS
jgi:ATP-binding cassette subfamily B protein